MKLIDIIENDYALFESNVGMKYIGKGQFWFDVDTHADCRLSGMVNTMEMERQRQLAIDTLGRYLEQEV